MESHFCRKTVEVIKDTNANVNRVLHADVIEVKDEVEINDHSSYMPYIKYQRIDLGLKADPVALITEDPIKVKGLSSLRTCDLR